jgi:serine/threonine protein kinase/formylglycine-generating enzyme required for sulfatase activity/predicted esterase
LSDKNWEQVSRIFNAALEKKASERDAYLDEVCAGNALLRSELQDLLSASEQFDSFIDSDQAAITGPITDEQKLSSGEKLGQFEVIRLLGIGGMGEVYLAKDLRLNRQVALKILPPNSIADPNATKRFLREAQAAASLEHTHICTIHEIGEENGLSFIVMQYFEGETLSERIKRSPLKPQEALRFALQIADALDEAHSHGIIHRDIKPANIIITPSNSAQVLDFGLAKKMFVDPADSESSLKTFLSQPGLIMGTVSYMSPEQVRGGEADARSDLWSLGVVLYEMLTGKTPFTGASSVEKLAAVLYQEPEQQDLPVEIAGIIEKALKKSPGERYQNADEMIADLKRQKQELEFEEQLKMHVSIAPGEKIISEKMSQLLGEHSVEISSNKKGRPVNIAWMLLSGLLAVAIVAGGWYGWKYWRIMQAQENLRRAEALAKEERNFEAYDLARQAEQVLPADDNLATLMPTISGTLSLDSEPGGAKIYLRRFSPDRDGKFPQREFIGVTPIRDARIALGPYILQLEKEGYAPFERSISGFIPRVGGSFIAAPPLDLKIKLLEKEKMPDRMVFVPGSDYSLVNWSRPTETKVSLNDYFIDKYEVSNREFKEFISAGGYQKKELWKFPIRKDGRLLTWEEVLREFRDKAGLPAPRSWSNQNYPPGQDDYPVTDITWYEAAAYAEFRGKKLPTVFQWEKAARDGAWDARYNALPWGFIKQGETTDLRANFRGTGPTPVTEMEFGMSPFGCYNMAGNVSEWCANQSPEGFVTGGGAWNDLAYSFGDYGEYPGSYSSNRIGFRCVLNTPVAQGSVREGAQGDQGGGVLPPAETPDYPLSSDADFKVWLAHYTYDKTPLNPVITETSETDDWRRETITFTGENNEQAIAYLYLPKNYARPLQVVHYVPAGDVVRGIRPLTDSVEMFLTPLIKSGRAVFTVVLKGYIGRPYPPNYAPPDNSTVEFRKQMVNWITDIRRGVDYLETRDDLDKQHLTFLGISNGANLGLLLTAVETRYKYSVFVSAGLEPQVKNWIAETNYINFASQSHQTKLVINGRYDETFPYSSDAKPLHKLFREPRKIVVYDGGHIPTVEFFSNTVNSWLDETIGSVKR